MSVGKGYKCQRGRGIHIRVEGAGVFEGKGYKCQWGRGTSVRGEGVYISELKGQEY